MQIVIDIPEYTYNYITSRCKYQNKDDSGLSEFEKAGIAIKNGTPLPKGHGKIADIDDIYKDICDSINAMTKIGIMVDGEYLWGKLNDALENALIIVEADKGDQINENR